MISKKTEAAITELLLSYLDGSRPFGFDPDEGVCKYSMGCAVYHMTLPENREKLVEGPVASSVMGEVNFTEQFREVTPVMGDLIQALHDKCAEVKARDYPRTNEIFLDLGFLLEETGCPFKDLEEALILFIEKYSTHE